MIRRYWFGVLLAVTFTAYLALLAAWIMQGRGM